VKIIDSIELVPGDIIELENNIKMPCDCILLDNEVLVDEQTLTGESVPVQKLPIKDSLLKKNILFDGTKIVFLRNAQAIVIRTGFSSYKG
jgi:cation-transporting ATPase 13A3/4/5